jgi:hypothetical protein
MSTKKTTKIHQKKVRFALRSYFIT